MNNRSKINIPSYYKYLKHQASRIKDPEKANKYFVDMVEQLSPEQQAILMIQMINDQEKAMDLDSLPPSMAEFKRTTQEQYAVMREKLTQIARKKKTEIEIIEPFFERLEKVKQTKPLASECTLLSVEIEEKEGIKIDPENIRQYYYKIARKRRNSAR